MNNADKNTNKKLTRVSKNKIKKGSRNGKTAAPKFCTISEAFYNDLIEHCIINGVSELRVNNNIKKTK